jgi:transposase
MTEPDKKRDKRFKKDVKSGLSIKELSEKYGIGERQVTRLKKKLILTGTSTETATSTSTTKRMTFWLPESTIEEIKELAAKEKRTSSAILREVLGRYLRG